ncbi:hypothetical protein K438DRAFT_1640094, partial [Mycena galopus ATCC 62051]
VMTMYSKSGGKAGTHGWVSTCDTIGSLSYMIVQLYQHSYRRQFKLTDRNYAALGTLRFAHLPANSFLALLPRDDELIKHFPTHLQVGTQAQKIFDELRAETEALGKAVASLNTVQRKGKANANLVDIDEEDEELNE